MDTGEALGPTRAQSNLSQLATQDSCSAGVRALLSVSLSISFHVLVTSVCSVVRDPGKVFNLMEL